MATSAGGVTVGLDEGAASGEAIAVRAYAPDGTPAWSKLGTAGQISALGMGTDAAGSTYLLLRATGAVNVGGTVDDGGAGTGGSLLRLAPDGSVQWIVDVDVGMEGALAVQPGGGACYVTSSDPWLYLGCVTAAGAVAWSTSIGTNAHAGAIAVDPAGNVYVAGTYDFDTQFGSTTLKSTGTADVFLASYDAAGHARLGEGGVGRGGQPDGHAGGVAGRRRAPHREDLGRRHRGRAAASARRRAGGGLVLARYSGAGALRSDAAAQGALPEHHLAFDGESVYLAGAFSSQLTLGSTMLTPGSNQQNVFVARYAADGSLTWAKASTALAPEAMCVEADGSLSLGGSFAGTATFGALTVSSGASPDGIFFARYDSGGNATHAELAAVATSPILVQMGCPADGRVYFGGVFDFDLDVGNGSVQLSSTAQRPAFVAVWSP